VEGIHSSRSGQVERWPGRWPPEPEWPPAVDGAVAAGTGMVTGSWVLLSSVFSNFSPTCGFG